VYYTFHHSNLVHGKIPHEFHIYDFTVFSMQDKYFHLRNHTATISNIRHTYDCHARDQRDVEHIKAGTETETGSNCINIELKLKSLENSLYFHNGILSTYHTGTSLLPELNMI